MHKDSIVIYKNNPALVTQEAEGKFSIQYISYSGKKPSLESQKIREKDALELHEGGSAFQGQSLLEKINEAAGNPEKITEINASLKEGWELLLSDETSSKTPFRIDELSELTRGSWDILDSFAFYKALCDSAFFEECKNNSPDNKIYFKCRSQEEADLILNKDAIKEKEAALHSEFISRLKQKKINLQEDSKYMQEIEAVALGKSEHSKVLKEAGFSEKIEKVHKLLVDTGYWDIKKNPWPARNGVSMYSATEHLPSPPQNEERLELDHTAYAIDNENSKDPDDAIAYDGKYLWIHIADPASTVTKDTAIDIAARNRGSTLYIPEGTARMLSEESLSDYALGLVEPERKSFALSFRLTLNEDCSIEDCEIFKSKVFVKRLTYKEAEEKKDSDELKAFFEIARKNIIRRKKAHCIIIELPEVEITLDAEKNVSIKPFEKNESSAMIREMMLLAGEGAARFAFKNKLSFPFVSQEEADIPKDLPDGLAGQYRLRRCMRSRNVGVTPRSHSALGLAMYSQVTSPLRRYSDLIAHQQLRAFIDNKKTMDKDEMLEKIAAGDAASIAVNKACRQSEMHWKLIYLLQNPDWTGKGVCVEIRGNQAIVFIPELQLETSLNIGNIKLNDEINIKIKSVNIFEQEAVFVTA